MTATLERDTNKKALDILLVEDNPSDARLLMEAFKECDMPANVFTVEDGVEAIKYLRKQNGYNEARRPCIVILDLNLPRKNGKEVLKEIKSDAILKTIPVVIFSTSTSPEDITSSYELSANSYISKPSDYPRLVEIIKSMKSFWFNSAQLPKEGFTNAGQSN